MPDTSQMPATSPASGQDEGNAPKNPRRRRFLRRAAAAAAAVVGGGVLSGFCERDWLQVRRISVPVRGLPEAFDGFTICQLTDLHLGRFISADQIDRAATVAMELHADLIALTGDYIYGRAANILTCAEALSRLAAEHGVFAVLGNHEYWSGAVELTLDQLAARGVRTLVNEAARVERAGAELWVCGVDDVWAGQPDLNAALAGVPEDAPKILLCHEPDFALAAAHRGFALQLSGHSHGGQIRLPLIGAPLLPYLGVKFPLGLQRIENSQSLVYTSAGVGVTTVPLRINCRPDVSLITLVVAGG
jgi:hypothetical protein